MDCPDPSFAGFPRRPSTYIAQGTLFFQAFIYAIFTFFFKERGKPARVNGSFAIPEKTVSRKIPKRQNFPFGIPFREKRMWRKEPFLKELR